MLKTNGFNAIIPFTTYRIYRVLTNNYIFLATKARKEVHMIIGYKEFLKALLDFVMAKEKSISNDLAVLEERQRVIQDSEDISDEVVAADISLEFVIDGKEALLAKYTKCRESIEDLKELGEGSYAEGVMAEYYSRVQEMYYANKADRTLVRAKEAAVEEAERELRSYGFFIFCGLEAYEEMMENAGEDYGDTIP